MNVYAKKGKPIACEIAKIPPNLKTQKTISVFLKKKILDEKYKRYYTKTYKRLVHYDREIPLKVGDKVLIHECRRISGHKSAICYGEKV